MNIYKECFDFPSCFVHYTGEKAGEGTKLPLVIHTSHCEELGGLSAAHGVGGGLLTFFQLASLQP